MEQPEELKCLTVIKPVLARLQEAKSRAAKCALPIGNISVNLTYKGSDSGPNLLTNWVQFQSVKIGYSPE